MSRGWPAMRLTTRHAAIDRLVAGFQGRRGARAPVHGHHPQLWSIGPAHPLPARGSQSLGRRRPEGCRLTVHAGAQRRRKQWAQRPTPSSAMPIVRVRPPRGSVKGSTALPKSDVHANRLQGADRLAGARGAIEGVALFTRRRDSLSLAALQRVRRSPKSRKEELVEDLCLAGRRWCFCRAYRGVSA